MKTILSLCLLLLSASCATPIRSTVDGFGEAPLSKNDPLYFDRNALPLTERPLSDACQQAAKDLNINVSDSLCAECKRVEVRGQLAGLTPATSGGPTFGTSIGMMGPRTGFGLGIGSGHSRIQEEAQRVIEIGIFDGKEMIRSLSARSVGRDNSVSAVAYEMCVAAFRDYPANLRGKVYNVKPGQAGG